MGEAEGLPGLRTIFAQAYGPNGLYSEGDVADTISFTLPAVSKLLEDAKEDFLALSIYLFVSSIRAR